MRNGRFNRLVAKRLMGVKQEFTREMLRTFTHIYYSAAYRHPMVIQPFMSRETRAALLD